MARANARRSPAATPFAKAVISSGLDTLCPDQPSDERGPEQQHVERDDAQKPQDAVFAAFAGVNGPKVVDNGSMGGVEFVLVNHPRQLWVLDYAARLNQRLCVLAHPARQQPTGLAQLRWQILAANAEVVAQQGADFANLAVDAFV